MFGRVENREEGKKWVDYRMEIDKLRACLVNGFGSILGNSNDFVNLNHRLKTFFLDKIQIVKTHSNH